MARDTPVLDCDDAAETDTTDGTIDRRTYLKMAGISVPAAFSLAAVGSARADEGYDVIEARGQTIVLDDGETFENKLIDLGDGNDVTIIAKGTNWTIRNVGFTGTYSHNRGTLFGVADTGSGSSTIENVYFGEGDPSASFSERGKMIWVDPDHSGHLDVRNCNFNIEGAIGIYGSAPSRNSNGNGGSIVLEGCYARNNHHTAYRVTGGEDAIRNCVAVMRSGAHANRGVWIEGGSHSGQVDIENVHIITQNGKNALQVDGGAEVRADGFHHTSGTLSVDGSVDWIDRSTDPQRFVPEGCPTAAEDAASGSSGTDSSESGSDTPSLEHTILVDGIGTTGASSYEFAVGGSVEKSNAEGASIDGSDTIESGHVVGSVAGWRDAFRFSGKLSELTVDGPARVFVDGDRVDPAEYGGEYAHTLAVVGKGVPSTFEITVDGQIEMIDADPADEATIVSGGTVEGSVSDDVQRFQFSGSLTDVTFVDGEAGVYVDGDAIDPAEYEDRELPPHAIVIDGTTATEPSTYSFSIGGDVIKSSYRDASVDDGDVVEGTAVRGGVGNWIDAYWFDGDIDDFTILGDASVDVEYNAREQ